jgi:FixJ family two-component response regulator
MQTIKLQDLEGDLFRVAHLVVHGKSNPEIGAALGLHVSTVKNRVATLLRHYGMAKRADLVASYWGAAGRPQIYSNLFVGGLIQLPKGAANVQV